MEEDVLGDLAEGKVQRRTRQPVGLDLRVNHCQQVTHDLPEALVVGEMAALEKRSVVRAYLLEIERFCLEDLAQEVHPLQVAAYSRRVGHREGPALEHHLPLAKSVQERHGQRERRGAHEGQRAEVDVDDGRLPESQQRRKVVNDPVQCVEVVAARQLDVDGRRHPGQPPYATARTAARTAEDPPHRGTSRLDVLLDDPPRGTRRRPRVCCRVARVRPGALAVVAASRACSRTCKHAEALPLRAVDDWGGRWWLQVLLVPVGGGAAGRRAPVSANLARG